MTKAASVLWVALWQEPMSSAGQSDGLQHGRLDDLQLLSDFQQRQSRQPGIQVSCYTVLAAAVIIMINVRLSSRSVSNDKICSINVISYSLTLSKSSWTSSNHEGRHYHIVINPLRLWASIHKMKVFPASQLHMKHNNSQDSAIQICLEQVISINSRSY